MDPLTAPSQTLLSCPDRAGPIRRRTVVLERGTKEPAQSASRRGHANEAPLGSMNPGEGHACAPALSSGVLGHHLCAPSPGTPSFGGAATGSDQHYGWRSMVKLPRAGCPDCAPGRRPDCRSVGDQRRHPLDGDRRRLPPGGWSGLGWRAGTLALAVAIRGIAGRRFCRASYLADRIGRIRDRRWRRAVGARPDGHCQRMGADGRVPGRAPGMAGDCRRACRCAQRHWV